MIRMIAKIYDETPQLRSTLNEDVIEHNGKHS